MPLVVRLAFELLPSTCIQVDAISWLEADIARLEQLILKERDEALKYAMTPSWFALFR
jgi:hypothetical protein